MKRKDWFIAGGLVAIGVILLVVASLALQPMGMGMDMGMMMVWAMFVPWIILILLFVFVVWSGRWVVSIVIQTFCRHKCSSCGIRIRHDWRVCPICGSLLQNLIRKSDFHNPKE